MIKQVQMVGCQSWENCSFSLDPKKVNVIIADNNTGKSVFFKMLKITACPKHFDADEQKDLIRKGFDKARIIFFFDDGAIGSTVVFPNKVMYFYRRQDDESFSTYLEPPLEMLQNIGLISDVKNNFIANIVDTDQDLLLVNHRLKSNADLMKLLVVCDDLENVRERADEILDTINVDIKNIKMFRYQLENILEKATYIDVEKEQRTISFLEAASRCMFALIDVAECLQKLNLLGSSRIDFNLLFKVLNTVQVLEQLNFRKILTKEKPVSSTFLKALTKLEALNVNKALVREKPRMEELRILELIENLHFIKCQPSQFNSEATRIALNALQRLENLEILRLFYKFNEKKPLNVKTCDALDKMSNLSNSLSKIARAIEISKSSKEKIHELDQMFRKCGEILECPVHRRILYDGKECIPYSP